MHYIHDGCANTYTLTKDGVKHKMKQSKDTNKKICSASKVCVVDGRKFLEGMRHEHEFFSIIPKDGKEEVEEVPIEVVDLLEEFSDIVLDNVPDGLPCAEDQSTDEFDQRRSLFFTRCRCEDKCCNVIIDGRSIDNLVSKMMVTKLKPKR